MHAVLIRRFAPLILILALVCLSGAATAAAAFAAAGANAGTVDRCCAGEAEESGPAEGACADPDCRCLSCCAPLLGADLLRLSAALEPPAPCTAPPGGRPGDYVRAIDYPPEHA